MSNINIVEHPIKDNKLLINNHEYFALGVTKILTGVVNTERQEIVKDTSTGLNYSRNAVEAQVIYDRSTKNMTNWFILDLETGLNPKRYFPGCEIHGEIRGENIEIKEAEDDTSATVQVVSNVLVKLLDIEDITDVPSSGWYHVYYNGLAGYVRKLIISNLTYAEPFK